jgi:hypothetical protein
MRPIAAPQNLHAMIVGVSHYNVALSIQRNTAPAADLPLGRCLRCTHAANVGSVAQTEHLNTAMHENIPAAIDRNAAVTNELNISTALVANDSYVAQHLHSIITLLSYNDVA